MVNVNFTDAAGGVGSPTESRNNRKGVFLILNQIPTVPQENMLDSRPSSKQLNILGYSRRRYTHTPAH